MAISEEIRERIIAAADELHEASETGEFPSVEAVRQLSRAGMNNVVETMKEWRQWKRKQVRSVKEPMPANLQSALHEMGQSLWATAQQLANESLEAARAAFEAEKGDLVQLSAEQSEAYDKQAAELEQVKAEAGAAAQAHQEATQRAVAELAALRRELGEATTRAERSEAKADEIERRATDLRAELDRAHHDAEQERDALAKMQATMTVERDTHREQQRTNADAIKAVRAELAEAATSAAEARERAAQLTGQLEATQQQASELLARVDGLSTKTRFGTKKEPKD